MDKVRIGKDGPAVLPLGLGCMGMSEFYGAADDAESIRTIQHALDRGVQLLDTADMYGPHTNERLVGRAIRDRRGDAVVATKFGVVRDPVDPTRRGIDGRPEYVRASCDGSLARLGIDTIDLYYQHRVDPSTPIEETVGAMAELVTAGKVRYLGLSECSAATLRRAHAVHPIAAVQSELSLWTRDAEAEVLPTCRELGVAFVAYSPLGRGFLSGTIKDSTSLEAGDFRRHSPRFQGDNLDKNLALVAALEHRAHEKHVTPAQLALAWVLAHAGVIAIPGTRKATRIDENLDALVIPLSPEELVELDGLFAPGAVSGERYPAVAMSSLNR